MNSINKILVLMVAILCFVLLVTWGLLVRHGYYRKLPMGYRMWSGPEAGGVILDEDPSSSHLLAKKLAGSSVLIRVGPDVDGYQVYPGFIIGHVSRHRHMGRDYIEPPAEQSRTGYFIINVRAHYIRNGMDKHSWMYLLERKGLTNVELQKP